MKVYFNGPILTMDDRRQKNNEILIEDHGRITYVGNEHDASTYINQHAEWIDLGGHTLMPALIDGHSHLSDTAKQLKMANLQNARSFDDIISILQNFIATHDINTEKGVVGVRYDHNFLAEHAHPTKDILDRISNEFPIIIMHASMHMGSCNSCALKLFNIDENTPEIEGGTIARIAGTNEPNGFLEESAIMPARVYMENAFPLTVNDLVNAQNYYMKNGILTIQEGAATEKIIDILKTASHEDKLICDIVAYPCFNFGAGVGNSVINNPELVRKYNGHLKIGGYKLLLDGSPQCKSAWLTEPYENEDSYRGYPWLTDDEVQAYIEQALEERMQILTHCNGDASSDQFLNAYERALAKYPDDDERHNLRPVMVHCQTARKDQIEKMRTLKMIGSVFVDHVFYWGDIHRKNLGLLRAAHISPLKTMLENHVLFNLHTDTPVVAPNLLHSVWAAVNRLTRNGQELGPEECISPYEALKAVTLNAAYSYFEENDKGTLAPGKRADMIIVDGNPLQMHKMNIQNIRVLECIKDGTIVYHI